VPATNQPQSQQQNHAEQSGLVICGQGIVAPVE